MAARADFLGLEGFVAVADRGSFNKAAAHLGITQAALSHRMRKLEMTVGVALFHRTTRQVALTPAGLELLPRAQALIDDARRMFAAFEHQSSARQERIAIGCLPTLAIHFLPPIIAKFSVQHPSTTVRVFDNAANEIAERVQKGEADFALTILTTNRWDLEMTPLAKEPYVLVCPANHTAAKQRSIKWSDLQGERLIRIAPQSANRILIDDALGQAKDKLRWSSEVQHVATAVSMVAAGAGLTVVPRGAIDVVRLTNLTCVAIKNPSIVRTLGVVTRRGIPLSSRAAELLAMIEKELKSKARQNPYS